MKTRGFKFLLAVMLSIGVLGLRIQKTSADSAGYYYESIDIDVQVNEAREYEITETLQVYFEEERHGIIRSIPNSSEVEGYRIQDVSVEGAAYTVEDVYDGIEVIIGDSEVTLSGPVTFVLHYTLAHYQDYDETADYVYLNLIGDDYDCSIRSLSARIEVPESAVFEDCTVTEGSYGSIDNRKISWQQEENVFYFQSNEVIRPYEAVTVQLRFNQGLFDQAPVYVFPYVIKEKQVEVQIDDKQDFYVTQRIVFECNQSYNYYYLNPDMSAFDYDTRVEILDFSGTLDGRSLTSEYSVSMEGKGEHELEYSYVLHPKKIVGGDVEFVLQDYYDEETQIENLSFILSLPKLRNYGISFQRRSEALNKDRFSVEETSDGLIFTSKSTLQAAEKAAVSVYLDADDYYRPLPLMVFLIPLLAAAYFGLVLILRFTRLKNPPLIAPVSFYPPKTVNSAEAGYLIDRHLTNEDVTSLIFSWAHKGALRIENISKKFVLVRQGDLPKDTPLYEEALFRAMFLWGEEDRVSESDLKNHFYLNVDRAKKAILNKYSGEIPFYDKKAKRLKNILAVLALVFPVLLLVFILMEENGSIALSLIMGITFNFPLLLVFLITFLLSRLFRSSGAGNYFKVTMITFAAIPVLILVIFGLIFIDQYLKQLAITFLFSLASILTALSAGKRTPEANQLLGQLQGFKQFLKTAEKDQLEMLLEENPEYFYEILPYAQTLHVTKIWQKKFAAIVLQPPTWYIGTESGYDVQSFARISQSVSRSMVRSCSRPASSGGGSSSSGSSSGGGYSGGGGGFSSGGHSGGGSGGGGSRSW